MTAGLRSMLAGARRRALLALPGPGVRFFVIGAGRGGTSMLAALLDAHPRLTVGMEYRAGFLQGINIVDGARVMDIGRRLDHFTAVCEAEARLNRGSLWGNKLTTERLAALGGPGSKPEVAARRFFSGSFAGTPVVFILRDGRTCVRSKMNRTGQTLEQACEWWRYSLGFRDCLAGGHGPYHELRYEDLVRDPAAGLAGVCRFLGVDYDEAMLGGTASEKLLPEYRQRGVSTSGLGFDGVPAGCEEILADDLRRCGYLQAAG